MKQALVWLGHLLFAALIIVGCYLATCAWEVRSW